MNLQDDIQAWDKKSKQDILNVYNRHSGNADFIRCLLDLSKHDDCSEGATWLLKHALENGLELNDQLIDGFCGLIELELPWQSILHILQLLPFITVPAQRRHQMMAFIRKSTEDENKFVRAWAYNGLYELANTYSEYRDGLSVVFDAAEETEPPAVKARIRNVKKAIAKNWS